jgi:hypothetical protein
LVVSVPLTLLGLLERGPSHGYDLKRDYDAYFGRGRPLRYSQVYATLSRQHDSDQVGVLLADHALYRLEADLRWIDHTAARLYLLERVVQR